MGEGGVSGGFGGLGVFGQILEEGVRRRVQRRGSGFRV